MGTAPWTSVAPADEATQPSEDVFCWGSFSTITSSQIHRIWHLGCFLIKNPKIAKKVLSPCKPEQDKVDKAGNHYIGSWRHVLDSALDMLQDAIDKDDGQ